MVLRNQSIQAYEEGRAHEGLELNYRASVLECLLDVREGRRKHYPHKPEAKPEGGYEPKPTNRGNRVRQYQLHARPRQYQRTYREGTPQKREANPRQLNKLVMCLIQDCGVDRCPVCKSQPPAPRKQLPALLILKAPKSEGGREESEYLF